MKKILLALILLAAISCEKMEMEPVNSLALNQKEEIQKARQWFEQYEAYQYPGSRKSANSRIAEEGGQVKWDESAIETRKNGLILTAPLEFPTVTSARMGGDRGDIHPQEYRRLVLYKVDGYYMPFILGVIPAAGSAATDVGNVFESKVLDTFSGMVNLYELSGKLFVGFVFEQGHVTAKSSLEQEGNAGGRTQSCYAIIIEYWTVVQTPYGVYSHIDHTERQYVCNYSHPSQIQNEDPSTLGGGGYIGSPDDFGLVGSGGTPGAGQSIQLPSIIVDGPDSPIADMSMFLKCLTRSEGGRVTIYVDQPVPGSRELMGSDFKSGHVFLTITQGQYTRTFGFYPAGSGVVNGPMQWGDDSGRWYDISLSFDVSATEISGLLDYIQNGTPSVYSLNNFNCTNFVVDAFSSIGISLPRTYSSSVMFTGLNPGDFGEDLKILTLSRWTQLSTNGGFGKNIAGDCN